jgi:hypothetical protein
MVTEAIFPSGRARAPNSGLPISPTRSPLPARRLRAPTTQAQSACLRAIPRVDPRQLRPPSVEQQQHPSLGSGAVSQGPPRREGLRSRRPPMMGGRYVAPRSPSTQVDIGSASRGNATEPLLGEVQTLGCPPKVTAPAPADARSGQLQVSGSHRTVLLRTAPLAQGSGPEPRASARRNLAHVSNQDRRRAPVESFDLRIDRGTLNPAGPLFSRNKSPFPDAQVNTES